MSPDVDAAVERLGPEHLRELAAIAWFCDSSDDGKHALIPSARRADYAEGGEMEPLVRAGCVRLLKSAPCAIVGGRRRPAIRMEQFGRQLLVRTRALGIDLDPVSRDEEE